MAGAKSFPSFFPWPTHQSVYRGSEFPALSVLQCLLPEYRRRRRTTDRRWLRLLYAAPPMGFVAVTLIQFITMAA